MISVLSVQSDNELVNSSKVGKGATCLNGSQRADSGQDQRAALPCLAQRHWHCHLLCQPASPAPGSLNSLSSLIPMSSLSLFIPHSALQSISFSQFPQYSNLTRLRSELPMISPEQDLGPQEENGTKGKLQQFGPSTLSSAPPRTGNRGGMAGSGSRESMIAERGHFSV